MVTADSGALLCYEGLANVEAFWGHEARARAVFQEGHAKRGGSSRFYRGWAQFEKKQAELEVSSQLPLHVITVANDCTVVDLLLC